MSTAADHLFTCEAVYSRSLSARAAADSAEAIDRAAYAGRALLDARYASSFFHNNKDRKRSWEISLNRAECYTVFGEIAKRSERAVWYQKAKTIEEDILRETSAYGPDFLPGEALVRYDLGFVLNKLAWAEDVHPQEIAVAAQDQLRKSLGGCAEDDAPGNGWRTIPSLFQKLLSRYWSGTQCPIDQDLWAAIKTEQLDALWILSHDVLDDGSYGAEAETLFQGAMTVLSEHKMPLQWAHCNLAFAGVVLFSRDPDATRRREATDRAALAALDNASRVFSSPEVHTREWLLTKVYSAAAHVELTELIRDSNQREQSRRRARELIHDIVSRFDESALRDFGLWDSVTGLSNLLQ
jgi:hypothetical protein